MTTVRKESWEGRRAMELRLKRVFDVLVASICLALSLPLMAVIALLIRGSMGRPVFFRQPRLGLEGRVFSVIKFRTMSHETEVQGRARPDEERLTALGAFLRRLTLDELPQLINVLRGEMSIVGPRPLLPEYWDLYTPDQRRRHLVLPGMAGPVVAGGRNLMSWEEKFRVETEYVDQWSLTLDLRILFRSALVVLTGRGSSAPGHATMPRFGERRGETHEAE